MQIPLSPKYGVNPTISVCFWCGKERGDIALLGRISDKKNRGDNDIEAPRNMVLDYEPCEKCKQDMALGFTVMEATAAPNYATDVQIQKGCYPTGRWVVITMDAAARVFKDVIDANTKKAFVDTKIFNRMFSNVEF